MQYAEENGDMKSGNRNDMADSADLKRSIHFVVYSGTVCNQNSLCKRRCVP